MRIAEQRDALGRQCGHGVDRGDDALHGLVRQAVHQVEAKLLETCAAQRFNRLAHLFNRLHASDGFLDVRVQILNPERCSSDSGGDIGVGEFTRHMTRIKLDRVRCVRRNIEPKLDLTDDAAKLLGWENIGRASAPMNFTDVM